MTIFPYPKSRAFLPGQPCAAPGQLSGNGLSTSCAEVFSLAQGWRAGVVKGENWTVTMEIVGRDRWQGMILLVNVCLMLMAGVVDLYQ